MNTLHTIFDWLLAASLRALLLTLVVFVVQWVLQRHLSPRWRYALWLPVLIVLLAPVLPESRWSIESVFQVEPPPVEIHPAPVVANVMPMSAPSIIPPSVSPPTPVDWQQIQLMTWALGALLLLMVGGFSFLRTLLRFQRSRQSVSADLLSHLDAISHEVGLRSSPRVLVAPAIQSPAVTGLLRPTLLLPAGFERDFTAEEARLILQHELTHLKRHDLPLNTLLCVLMALHWFNPLLWLAFFKARADREAACDAQVLVNATPQRRSEYGHALLKVEAAFAPLRLSLGFVGMLQRG
ncbi:MAG: M56 family metallopeptidase, partial [Prosthecobacter sp.]|nr:M56 family metallopeptidase [Prosthecobacter sp.]